jgi:hypothetical protein
MESFLDGNVRRWHELAMGTLPFYGSAYRSPDGEVVWIDPPALGADEAEVLALGKPSHILVTFRDHDRAVDALAQRFGAKVWIPRGKGGSFARIDEEFGEDTTLPAGLKAVGLPAMGYGEHALVGEAYGQRFAFIGDAVFNHEDTKVPWLVRKLAFKHRGGPLWMKRSYRGGDDKAAPEQLKRLLDLRLDALYLSHGKAVPQDADRYLRQVLGEA